MPAAKDSKPLTMGKKRPKAKAKSKGKKKK
jgi:hypothetical protein